MSVLQQVQQSAITGLGNIKEYLVGPYGLDERVANWPLIDVWTPVIISLIYFISIPAGTYFMRDRKALKIKTFTTCHNVILFGLSLYMSIETTRWAYINFNWANKFQMFYNRVERGDTFSHSGYMLARILYIHYISKAYEFMDTWIMIAKKNHRQISFLHVYHHATTFYPVWWAVVRYGPGGSAWLCCALNSFIHVLMYGYYCLSGLGFKSKMVKPIVTSAQIIQFITLIYQGVYLLIISNNYTPKVQPVLLTFQCLIFLVLFVQFFWKTYISKQGKKKAQ